MMAGKPDCNLLKTNDMRPLKTYCTPSLRSLPLQTESSFLTSAAGGSLSLIVTVPASSTSARRMTTVSGMPP